MSFDFERRMCSFSPYSLYDISRRYQGNIFKKYYAAWDDFEYIDNKSIIRSCEQKIIKLDKIELQHSLQQLCIKLNILPRHYYPSKEIAYVLFHLINVFCKPGQEEKMRLVQVKLNEVLHTVTEEERCDIIERYISQLLKAKSSLTEIDMLTGQIDSQHELLCKLFYWDKFYSKNGNEGCKEFLKINADFLVSNIEGMATNWGFMWHKKLQLIACNILLCFLNWNICKTQKPVILQKDKEKPAPSSVSLVADQSTNYSFTNRASNMLQKILSTLSEEEIFKAFNDYLEQMYAMNSEITEDDFCSNKIEPYHECMLKLCYCTGKWSKTEVDFITKNTEFFLSKVEEVNKRNQLRVKFKMCQVLSIIMNGKIHITESMIFSVTKMHINDKYSGRLTDSLSIKIDTNRIIACIFDFFKTKLNNLRTLTEKISIQYQDHIKELLLSLLAAMLTLLSTQEIHKAVYLFFCTERKAIDKKFEMEKRSQETETLVLLMLLLITITSTGHHKSAKLKKYLTLKYEYATASLHLLWCSGDIEVHPGPSLNKKALAHDSTIERRWIQNISPKILSLLPEHEQSKYKPTKKVRNVRENREHFKLLKTRLEEKVHVPKMYLAEINAWETMEYTILHKLFVYRCEIETVIASLQDLFICGGSTKDLTDINVSLDTELKTNDITAILGKDHRPTDKSQLMVYITRHIAGISIKCAHEKDPDAKCDGLWDLPLKNWPKQIILFDPNNRGKYTTPGQKLIPDQELVDILLTLPQVTIPQKYKDVADAFRTMRKSQKDKSINKQHKAELCSTFKRINSLEKLDYALKNLWESGIFTEEVHNNLNKWWTTGTVDTANNQKLSQVDIIEVQKRRRPHILINISTKSITLTVEKTDANSSQVSYDFPFKDECVPLKTSQAILESDIKHQHKISTEETALSSTIDFDEISSATKNSQSLDFHTHVSPTSDLGSSDSISSVNSESGNDDGDIKNTLNEGQDLLTDSDYSSDSSNNFVSKTNMKKRKFTEEDRNETKKRKLPSQEDKKSKETNHRQMDCLMDNTASFNKNREILPDWLLDSDLDSYNIDDQTFKVDLNALDDEDTELVKFLKDIIDGEGEMKSCNLDK